MKRVLLIDSEVALFQVLAVYLPNVQFDRAANLVEQSLLLAENKYCLILVNQCFGKHYVDTFYLNSRLNRQTNTILNLEFNQTEGLKISSYVSFEIKDMRQLSFSIEKFLKLTNLENN